MPDSRWVDLYQFETREIEHGEALGPGYEAWCRTKRHFSRHELLRGQWLKVTDESYAFLVELGEEGTLLETALFEPVLPRAAGARYPASTVSSSSQRVV
jgi:hypothetical protein